MKINVVESLSDLLEHGSDIAPLDAETLNGSRDIFAVRRPSMIQGLSADKGAIAELSIAILLLRNGYEPYMPLQGKANGKLDMLAVHKETGKVVRLHVRSAHLRERTNVYAYSGRNIVAEVRFLDVDREEGE